MTLFGGPIFLNWWEWEGVYLGTSIFAGAALAGIFNEIASVRDMVLAGNKMLWRTTFPDEPPL